MRPSTRLRDARCEVKPCQGDIAGVRESAAPSQMILHGDFREFVDPLMSAVRPCRNFGKQALIHDVSILSDVARRLTGCANLDRSIAESGQHGFQAIGNERFDQHDRLEIEP